MKLLVSVLLLASFTFAQTSTDKAVSIPDFKVTEQTLAQSMPKKQSFFVYPPQLRNGPIEYRVGKQEPLCLTMRSYNFDKSATPKLVSETNCTPVEKDGYLRVRR